MFFSIFSQLLSLGIFSRHSVAAVWGLPKSLSVQNNMEVVNSDGETMRSLCGYWYVCDGVWRGIGKGGESCGRKKGKRNVEERRG